jgi:prephenate dehydrogenase
MQQTTPIKGDKTMKQKIAIIGTGLIGGSLGLALKQAKVDAEIVGHDKNSSSAALAKKNGAVDKTEWNLHSAVDEAGLVILAMPVMAIKSTLEAIASTLREGAIVTDTASAKQQVIAWAEEILPRGIHFIGGHPLTAQAGTGIESASATLFKNKAYCLIPAHNSAPQALETMVNLAQMIGARPYFLDPLEHDSFMAAVGHVPFLAATALVHMSANSPAWKEIRRVAGIDFETASLPVMADPHTYADICLTNKDAILRWLGEYIGSLTELKGLVEQGGPDLLSVFSVAQDERAKWLATRDDDLAEMQPAPSIDGTGSAIKQMFLGNLMRERPLPGEDKKKQG